MAKGRKTGGRRAGTPNKATREIKELALPHGPVLMKELIRLALNAESEAARVAAIKEAFDRGWGKATQAIEHAGKDGGPIEFSFSLDNASSDQDD